MSLYSHDYPAIVYMPFNWNQRTYDAFIADSHRGRYLRSSIINNAPNDETPLYAIQFISQRAPIFVTTTPSLVFFATDSAYYVASTQELVSILGQDKKDDSKFTPAPWLWDESSLDKGKDNRRAKAEAMVRFYVPSLEDAYHRIISYCSAGGSLHETFTPSELRSIIPRPSASSATSVGSALGAGKSSEPPSRRGEKHKFARRKKRKLNDGANTASEEDGRASGSNSPKVADEDDDLLDVIAR